MRKRFSFSKEDRLCGLTTIDRLFRQGNSLISYPLRVVWTAESTPAEPTVRVLVSVPKKKLKHAVDRNRVKRLVREAYRLHCHDLKAEVNQRTLSVNIAFVWLPSECLDFAKVERKMVEALQKLRSQWNTLPEKPLIDD